jgi:hypothetical protein
VIYLKVSSTGLTKRYFSPFYYYYYYVFVVLAIKAMVSHMLTTALFLTFLILRSPGYSKDFRIFSVFVWILRFPWNEAECTQPSEAEKALIIPPLVEILSFSFFSSFLRDNGIEKLERQPSMVVHTCNPSTQEA